MSEANDYDKGVGYWREVAYLQKIELTECNRALEILATEMVESRYAIAGRHKTEINEKILLALRQASQEIHNEKDCSNS